MENREKTLNALRSLALQRLTYEQAFPQLLEILAKACGADAVAYLLYDEEGEKLVFQSITYGLRGEEEERQLLGREITLEEGGLSVEVFQKGEPILVKDAKTHPTILKDISREI
jgi:hypothetical protein